MVYKTMKAQVQVTSYSSTEDGVNTYESHNQDKRKEVVHEKCPFSFLQLGNHTSQENEVPFRISTSCGTYSHYLV